MNLTKDEKEFLQEWEINRKTKRVIIRLFAFPVIISLFDIITNGFDTSLKFYPEEITNGRLLIKLIGISVIWGVFIAGQFYFNEKKYKRLTEKKQS